MKEQFNSDEIAKLLGISKNEVFNMVSRGDSRFPKFHKRKLVRVDDRISLYTWNKQEVLDWIAKNG